MSFLDALKKKSAKKTAATSGAKTGGILGANQRTVSNALLAGASLLSKNDALSGALSFLGNFLRPPVGAFSIIVFEVSSQKVLTYDEYKRETKARYARHELINQPTVLEFLGRDLEEISFTMRFSSQLGINPKDEAQKARQLCQMGVADQLILGDRVIGEHLWTIESVSEDVTAWDNAGNILFSTVDVKMLEYIERLNET